MRSASKLLEDTPPYWKNLDRRPLFRNGLRFLLLCSVTLVAAFPLASNAAEVKGSLHVRPAPPAPARLSLTVDFQDPSANKALDAEETALLKVTVANAGPGDASGVIIKAKALPALKEVVLPGDVQVGTVKAGSKVAREMVLAGKRELAEGTLKLELQALEQFGFDSAPVSIQLATRSFQPPKLVVADMGIDDGNQNAQVEPAEIVQVTARIQNQGLGPALGAQAQVLLGGNLFLHAESRQNFDLGDMGPGETKDVTFAFYTNNRVKHGDNLPLELLLTDQLGREQVKTPLNLVMNAPHRTIHELVVQPVVAGSSAGSSDPGGSLMSDVDTDPPAGKGAGPYDVALLIGNRHYQRTGVTEVPWAQRDVQILKRHLIKTMGFTEKNIQVVPDATKGTFETWFGTRTSKRGKLSNLVDRKGRSKVFIYYVGHGAPDPETGNSYFVPVDADPDYIANSGYALSAFYENINQLPTDEVIIVLDACFSGQTPQGSLFSSSLPVNPKVKDGLVALPNGAVLASAQPEQFSAWYDEQKHGLFTYFFLKGLRGEADANHDRRITVAEMRTWLEEEVPSVAARLVGREQNPVVRGKDDMVLVTLK